MGVFDTAKLINKARKAKKRMEQIEVVGVDAGAMMRVLINGLGDLVDVDLDLETLKNSLGEDFSDDSRLKEVLENGIREAFKDAKKNLEKELASTNLEDLKDLLS